MTNNTLSRRTVVYVTTVLRLWSQSSRLSHYLPLEQRETAQYAILCTPFSRHGPRVYTARGKLPA